MPLTGESEAILQSKVRSGVYSDISTLAANIQKTIQSDRQWHSGRLMFQNEKEGPYISRPRFYGNYSIRISINNKWTLFGGAAIGLVNSNYNTPSKVINTTLPDGALGIILTYENSLFGMSSNQIFNNFPSSIPSIKLNRYYNFHFETTIPIQEDIDFKTYLACRYFSDIPAQINGIFSLLFNAIIETGVGYNYQRGTAFFTSYIMKKENINLLKIGVLYNNSLLQKSQVLGNSLELNLGYNF